MSSELIDLLRGCARGWRGTNDVTAGLLDDAAAEIARLSVPPSDDKRHGGSPLTEHEIMVLREEMLSDDGFLPEGKERVARLCDMALASIVPSAVAPLERQTDEKGRPMTYWGGAKSANADKAPAELAVALMALRRHLLATKAPVSEAQLDDLEQAEHALRTVAQSAIGALVPQDLIHAARNAEAKLSYLGKQVFGHPAFTDRYQDGPSCIATAEKLRKALDVAISNRADSRSAK